MVKDAGETDFHCHVGIIRTAGDRQEWNRWNDNGTLSRSSPGEKSHMRGLENSELLIFLLVAGMASLRRVPTA
jgi:hypothetical protein